MLELKTIVLAIGTTTMDDIEYELDWELDPLSPVYDSLSTIFELGLI